jgi:hypothetical protein
MQRAGANDNLFPCNTLALPSAKHRHSDGAAPLELYALYVSLGENVQVRSQPSGAIEVTKGCRNAMAVHIVFWKRETSITKLGVTIIEVTDTVLC